MNREIKFRAWDNNSKFYVSQNNIKIFAEGSFEVWDEINDVLAYNKDHIGSDFILMQYTGLKDKNGKEIYEGDIFRCWGRNGFVEQAASGLWILSFSEMDNDCVCLSSDYDKSTNKLWRCKDEEIIGNIHENPELLKCLK
ncbi:MAG: YopX family protein [Candidatus Omnitrophota bacterium]